MDISYVNQKELTWTIRVHLDNPHRVDVVQGPGDVPDSSNSSSGVE